MTVTGDQGANALTLVDARGVPIEPGDTVIYGFGVDRSVAMAEGVVVGEPCACRDCSGRQRPPGPAPDDPPSVSLTASGRVRVRVIRRSYNSGVKPVVDIAPDRLVVLKRMFTLNEYADIIGVPALPPSPLPTQDEEARKGIEESMARSTEALRATEAPEWWTRANPNRTLALAEYHKFHAAKLAEDRRKLRALDDN